MQYKQILPENPKWLQKVLAQIMFRLPKGLVRRLFLRGSYDLEVAYLEGFPTKVVSTFPEAVKKIAFVHCDISADNPIASIYTSNAACLRQYQGFNRVCFVSGRAKTGFLSVVGDPGNACVVHNVMEIGDIFAKAEVPAAHQYQANGLKLVTVGRLTEPKKFDRLLRIAERLEKDREFELWIIGDGDLRQDFETYIAEHDIRSVKLLGFQSNPYSLVKQADLFVCSSLYEGYSTAVTEALLLNVPVLTTACAGMDEIVLPDKHGWIVENSEKALQEKLECLMTHPEEIRAMKTKLRISAEKYNADHAAEEYLELFRTVVE